MKKTFKNVAMMLFALAALTACGGAASQSQQTSCGQGICPSVYDNLPFEMKTVEHPCFPD